MLLRSSSNFYKLPMKFLTISKKSIPLPLSEPQSWARKHLLNATRKKYVCIQILRTAMSLMNWWESINLSEVLRIPKILDQIRIQILLQLKARQLCVPGDPEGWLAGRSVLGRAPPRPSPGSRPARSRSAAGCPPAPHAASPPPAAGQTRRIQSVPTGSRSASASAGWSTLHIIQ